MKMNGALLRTLIVAAGVGFVGAALGSACLDYAGEDWGACATTVAAQGSSSTGAGSGVGSARLGAGSGEGTGAPAAASTADCGAPAPSSGGDAAAARP